MCMAACLPAWAAGHQALPPLPQACQHTRCSVPLPPTPHPCRAVLSLDDDIMLPCTDVEAAFARWRADPAKMVGFFPRLLEGAPPVFRGEA